MIIRWILSILLLLGLAIGAGYYWWHNYRTTLDANTGTPILAQPQMRKLTVTVVATGTIRLRTGSEVRVGSQLSGIVRRLYVTIGSRINKGDIIAEIDPRNLQARLEQARAQVKVDEVALRRIEIELARSKKLVAAGIIPRQQIEDLELEIESAQARLEKSQRDLAVVEVDLAYVKIPAPISGTVAAVSIQEGETIAASFTAPTFVTIIEDGALELIAMVDETDIGSVKPGNQVVFTTEAYPTREFIGSVQRVAAKATIVSGVVNYEVAIKINNGLELLKPDMTANITIKTLQHDALVVPNSAIQRVNDE
ncbi:MAG: efflux RND transporter periplasmic adaptor subunit, partial [Acidobacteriota bacterium]